MHADDGQLPPNSSRSSKVEPLSISSARSINANSSWVDNCRSDLVQELTDKISILEEKLQLILVKQNELGTRVKNAETDKLVLEHKLNQKSELFEQLNMTMQSMSHQSSSLIQAQMERICYLENALEPERQANQRLKDALSEKKAECLLLQEALDELDKERAQEQEKIKASVYQKAELALTQKMDAERKNFLRELEKVQEQVKMDLLKNEQLTRSNEYLELRAALVHLQSTCSVYDELILYLDGHTDRAGLAKISETYQRLHLAGRVFISSLTTKPADRVDDFSKSAFDWVERRRDTARSIEDAVCVDLYKSGRYFSAECSREDSSDAPLEDVSPRRSPNLSPDSLALDLEALKHHSTRRWTAAARIYDGPTFRR
jgi:hypothetical protein